MSASAASAATGGRESLKSSGLTSQTGKRAKVHAELSAQRRAEAHSKRRRGHDDADQAAGTLEERKTDEQVNEILRNFASAYVTSSNPLTPSVAANPAVPFATRAAALQALRLLVSNDDAPLSAVVAAGVVPMLITELSGTSVDGTPATQMDALWCLTNIASGTTAHTRAVLPAAPALIALLSAASSKVQEQCVWCLGNLASEEQECRRQLLDNGILVPLVRLLQQGVPSSVPAAPALVPAPADVAQLSLLRVVAWTLSNLVKSSRSTAKITAGAAAGAEDAAKHTAAFTAIASDLLPTALALFRSHDDQLATEVSWMLSAWVNHGDDILQSICSVGLVEALMSRLTIIQSNPLGQTSSSGVVVDSATGVERDPLAPSLIPLIRIIGNIAHASDALLQAALSYTFPASASTASLPTSFHLVLSTLDRSLSSIHRGLKKETCWVISNLAATDLPFVHEALVTAPQGISIFLQKLYALLARGNFDLQREAAHALYNLCRDERSMPFVLPRYDTATPTGQITLHVLRSLFEFLRSRDTEATLIALRLIEVVLRRHPDGLQLVEENGGIDALETVQTQMENAELVAYAHKLVDEFFGAEEEELDDMAQPDESEYPAWRMQQTPPKGPPAGGFQFG